MSALITACFLYEGQDDYIRGIKDEKVTERFGAIERAQIVSQFAEAIEALVESIDRDRPGVLEYDVTSQVGWFIAERLDTTGEAPTQDEVLTEAQRLLDFHGYVEAEPEPYHPEFGPQF